MQPYNTYSSAPPPLLHATSSRPYHPFSSPPNLTLYVAATLLHNPYLGQVPASRPSDCSLNPPMAPPQLDAEPLLSVDRAPELHPTLEEFEPHTRCYLELDSVIPSKPVCVASGLRPVKRFRTDEPPSDQSHSTRRTSISSLNHDVLLEIFDWYFTQESGWPRARPSVLAFRAAMHVCRSWRYLILGSPKRFDLELHCTYGAPVADLLTHFPSLPIQLDFEADHRILTTKDEDGILRAMKQSRRLRHVDIKAPYRTVQRISAAMNGYLPLLEVFKIFVMSRGSNERLPASTSFIFPSTFSAPRLTSIQLERLVPLIKPPASLHSPALERHHLYDIPSAVLLPPELLVELLSAMPLLGFLNIRFQFPGLHRGTATAATISPSTRSRISLPRLVSFHFNGAREYCDDLMSQISAPSLSDLDVRLFNRLPIALPNAGSPSCRFWRSLFATSTDVSIVFLDDSVYACSGSRIWEVLSRRFDWQVASLAEFFQSLDPALLNVDNLGLLALSDRTSPRDASEPEDWCNLLRPFSNVKKLRVQRALRHDVSRSLMSNGALSLDLLPELQTLGLEPEPDRGDDDDDDDDDEFTAFLEARERANRPVSVECTLLS
ncbi:hypothetical protein BC834DRAFT_975357 [Gloeopeniophorella convolvens]|nr:hypothetical protein BC834DRAFT_975357 [Gloeopeniophorella convolvens]